MLNGEWVYSVFIVSVATNTFVCSEAICRFADCYSGWYLVTHWLKRFYNYFSTSYFSFMKIHVTDSSYGRNLNFQTKGLTYIAAFCAQFLELGCSNPPQSLGGKCSIFLIITYHNTPVPGVNVFGGK
jgi:hypothetical protein